MKKTVLWMLIVTVSISLVVSMTLLGCKDGAAEEAIGETSGEATEEVSEEAEEVMEEATVVAEEGLSFVLADLGAEGSLLHNLIRKGMEDAGALLGAEVLQTIGDTAAQIASIEAAIAGGATGIGVNIADKDSFDGPIQAALDAGIPVVSFNQDDEEGADGSPRLAYVGQEGVGAGYAIGKHMATFLEEGDHVVCPVEFPGMVYANQRFEGISTALAEKGITSEWLDAGIESDASIIGKIQAYLQGHPETDGVIPMGSVVTDVATIAVEELGLLNNGVIVGGFDFSQKSADDIKAGKSMGAIDQQGYSQGFLSVMYLYMAAIKFQTLADVNTGAALVTTDNIEQFEAVFRLVE